MKPAVHPTIHKATALSPLQLVARGWAWGLSVFFLAWAASGQELTAVLVGPAGPVVAGTRTSLWLHHLNTSARQITTSFPARLEGQFVSDRHSCTATLELNAASGAREAGLPPNGFARREYWLAVPESLTGRVVLEVPQSGAARIVLEVQEPATAPAARPPAMQSVPSKTAPAGLRAEPDPVAFFKKHLFPNEPFYFIAGTKSPNAKFQVSVKYRLVDPEGGLGHAVPPVADVYLGYTQTSLWYWNQPSAPFLDTSYKPALFYHRPRLWTAGTNGWFRLDLQAGLQHESNGRDGPASRSMNFLYFQPSLVFGYADSFQVTLAPRAWCYIWDLSDNPDIARYRGHADLLAIVGWERGLQLATRLRLGDDGGHATLQFDLSFPLHRIPGLGLTAYLHAQYFTGYGETFLLYREKLDIFRAGFSLYR